MSLYILLKTGCSHLVSIECMLVVMYAKVILRCQSLLPFSNKRELTSHVGKINYGINLAFFVTVMSDIAQTVHMVIFLLQGIFF